MLEFDLIIITSPTNYENEEDLISVFLDNGASSIYLRKDVYSNEYVTQFFQKINPEHHHKILLPFSVVDDVIYKKYRPIIHFKEKDRTSENLSHLASDAILSTSIHDLSELENLTLNYKYIFYSPVFGSISKPDYKPKFSLEDIALKIKNEKVKSIKLEYKLIALGGITEKNIIQIKNAGFDGAALLGAIWNNENPREVFQLIKSKIK